MESIREKAEDYQRRASLKNPGNPAEIKQAHDEIVGYLQALGKEYSLESTLEVLNLIGHYLSIVSSKDGFAVAVAIEETDILENGMVTTFAIVFPQGWHESPGVAIEKYVSSL